MSDYHTRDVCYIRASPDVPSWGHSRIRPGKDMLRLEIGSPSPRLLEQSGKEGDASGEI